MEVAVQSNKTRCFLSVPFSYTIRHWFGVNRSHDIEGIEKNKPWSCKNIFAK